MRRGRGAARFRFGVSYQFKQPVLDIIAERFPATIELSIVSALFSAASGIPLGVYTALNRDSWVSKLFLSVSLVGFSLPVCTQPESKPSVAEPSHALAEAVSPIRVQEQVHA